MTVMPSAPDEIDQFPNGVGRIDQHALTGSLVAHRVDEVDHLGRERVADREVASGEQLSEVEGR